MKKPAKQNIFSSQHGEIPVHLPASASTASTSTSTRLTGTASMPMPMTMTMSVRRPADAHDALDEAAPLGLREGHTRAPMHIVLQAATPPTINNTAAAGVGCIR
jgi:hypothetical protein